jgi:hypothetical protein
MVKLQPSKLAMRVRFPLPAPSFSVKDLRNNRSAFAHFPNTFSSYFQGYLDASTNVPRPTLNSLGSVSERRDAIDVQPKTTAGSNPAPSLANAMSWK